MVMIKKCIQNNTKPWEKDTERYVQSIFIFIVFFIIISDITVFIFSFVIKQNMQKLNEILCRRLISISEISQLTMHLISERDSFLKHNYMKMEIDRVGVRAGISSVGNDNLDLYPVTVEKAWCIAPRTSCDLPLV
jgi:hypothetical protein